MKHVICFILVLALALSGLTAVADSNPDQIVNFDDLPADYRALYASEMASALANARARAPGQSKLAAMARGDFSGYQGSKADNSLRIDYKVTDSVVAVGEKVTFYVTMTWDYGHLTYTYGGQVMDEDFNSIGPLVPVGKPNSFVYPAEGEEVPEGTKQIGRAFSFTPQNPGYFNYVIILKDGNGNTLALTTPTVQVYEGEEPSYSGAVTDTVLGGDQTNQLGVYVNTDRQSTKVGTEITALTSFTTKHAPVQYTATWILEDASGTELDVQITRGEVNASSGTAEVQLSYLPLQMGVLQLVIQATDGYGNAATINTPWIDVADGFYFTARLNRVSAMTAGEPVTATYEAFGHHCSSTAYYVGWECYDADGNTISTNAKTVLDRAGKDTFTPRQGQGLEFYFGATCEHFGNPYPARVDIVLLNAIEAELELTATAVQSGKSIGVKYAVDGGLTPYQQMVVRGYSKDTARNKTYQFLEQTVTEAEGTVTGTPYLGNEVYFELEVVERDGVSTAWISPKATMTGSPMVADLKLTASVSPTLLLPGEQVTLVYKMTGGSGTVNKSGASYLQWKKADGTILEKKTLTSASGTETVTLTDEGTYTAELVLTDGYNQRITWTSEAIVVSKDAYLLGDANNDGQVTAADALLVMQYTAGWSVSLNKVNADVNTSGSVDLQDAILIFRKVAGEDVF